MSLAFVIYNVNTTRTILMHSQPAGVIVRLSDGWVLVIVTIKNIN